MADVYTSIQTAGGWQTNTVTAAYDLLFRKALNIKPTCRQFVDVRPERPTHTGNSITLQLENYFAESAVTAAKTPLVEESDVSAIQVPATTPITLTPLEYGNATISTLKLANRSMVPLDPAKAMVVADNCYKVMDELLQDQMVTGTQVYRGGGAASTGALVGANVLTSDMIRQAVTKLRANGSVPRDGENYVGLVHPNVVYDIRSETGSGGWRNPNEYGTDQGQIWRGEFGLYEGVRWVQNARLRKANDGAASIPVHRSFLLGSEALAEAVVTEPHVVVGPVVDKLQRFRPLGWYGDIAFKLFRDLSLVRFETATKAS